MSMYGRLGIGVGRFAADRFPAIVLAGAGSSHHASRPGVHGTSIAAPARRTTSTRATEGAAATAASATAFSRTHAAAAEEAVRGDEDGRLAVGQRAAIAGAA